MSSLLTTAQPDVTLHIVAKDGRKRDFSLSAGSSIMVGSAPNCSLHLKSESVSPIHCLLRSCDGVIWVQDWNTAGGTFIDGVRIVEETALPPGSEVRLGDFSMRLQERVSDVREAQSSWTASPQCSSQQRSVSASEFDLGKGTSVALADRQEATAPIKKVPSETTSPRPAPVPLPVKATSTKPILSAPPDPFSLCEDPSWDDETVELLRAEVEHLQKELAERDNRLAELASAEPDWDGSFEQSGPAGTTALVERLENLLDELEQRDERVAALEDLLRANDEAVDAEQEERRQLEAWLTDIEQRIGRREGEWRAESEALQRRLDSAIADRERLELHLRQMAASGNEDAYELEIQRLTEQLRQLRQQWEESERERVQAAAQLATAQQALSQPAVTAVADASLREERLQIAQERAALARQRAELAQQRDELERSAPREDKRADADGRVNDFRRHLREIHEQERQQEKQRGLASRVAQIWRRLEGREG